MNTREALHALLPLIGASPAVFATGYIARAAKAVSHRRQNFYVIGSMGICSSIGLGIALARPDRQVIVFDGDGSALMNLGHLAQAGALKPKNFVHVVLDNEAYASTGSQKSISSSIALERVAQAAGYQTVVKGDPAKTAGQFKTLLAKEGPSFFLLKVGPDTETPSPRIHEAPEVLTRNFMSTLQ